MHRYQKLYMSFNFSILTQFSKEFEASNDTLSLPFITAHVGIILVPVSYTHLTLPTIYSV